jgi:hypothetical protein
MPTSSGANVAASVTATRTPAILVPAKRGLLAMPGSARGV